jgi:hypothetical protein
MGFLHRGMFICLIGGCMEGTDIEIGWIDNASKDHFQV